jgi:low temperature requirement protein LtrA
MAAINNYSKSIMSKSTSTPTSSTFSVYAEMKPLLFHIFKERFALLIIVTLGEAVENAFLN